MARVPAPFMAIAFLGVSIVALLAAGKVPNKAYPWMLPMIDQKGKAFDLADASGHTLVLSFLFTHCGSACPMQTSRLARVQSIMPDSLKARTRFVSVSIDPERDSTAALADYAEAFRIEYGHWRLGATTDTAALARLASALGVSIRPGRDGSPDHEMAVLLIDAAGAVAQRYTGDKVDEARLLREIGDVDRVLGKRHP